MKYGYCRPKTNSQLIEFKQHLKADEMVVDLVNVQGRGSNEGLATIVDKLVKGDEFVVISLTNAFSDMNIMQHTIHAARQLGVRLYTIDGDFDTNATSDETLMKSLDAVFSFQIEKETQDCTSRSYGAKRIEYPKNFLEVLDKYNSGDIHTLRDAAAECFVALNTFRNMVAEFNR